MWIGKAEDYRLIFFITATRMPPSQRSTSTDCATPFRIALHPEMGLFINDVGWKQWEEINYGPAGANFGWPCYEGEAKQVEFSEPIEQGSAEAVVNY